MRLKIYPRDRVILTGGCIQLGGGSAGGNTGGNTGGGSQGGVTPDSVAVINRYAPVITEVGYNGRRGDGRLSSQGWRLTNAVETVSDNPDALGGHVASLSKSRSGRIWQADQEAMNGGDLIRYGGKLRCRFRITTPSITSGRYAFAFYWRIVVADIPAGVQMDNRTLGGASPCVLSCIIGTDSQNIILSRHANDTPKICDLCPFDNEWHDLEFDFPGGNSITITPVFDGATLTPFSMTYSKASVSPNVLVLTDITSGTTYATEFASFSVFVCRDDGTVTLRDADASSYVYFPEQHKGGRVVIPDTEISAGNTIEIANSGGPVTVQPASGNVLVKAPGGAEALPSAFTLSGSGVLVQANADGKTWVATKG